MTSGDGVGACDSEDSAIYVVYESHGVVGIAESGGRALYSDFPDCDYEWDQEASVAVTCTDIAPEPIIFVDETRPGIIRSM